MTGCSTQKKEAELLELSKPQWLKERPVSTSYFYGIGISPKVGGQVYYEEQAREKALADISKQISTQIKSDQSYYRMEDGTGVYEYIQSRVRATSEEFLEGYELLDEWEDLNNRFAFYRLSKSEFYARKAKRKEEALQLGFQKYELAQEAQQRNDIITALEQYAASIDAVSGYMNEATIIQTGHDSFDVYERAKEGLTYLLSCLQLSYSQSEVRVEHNSNLHEGTTVLRVSKFNQLISGIPVRFRYSGGFLASDKYKSDDKGMITTPSLSFGNKPTESLKAELDLQTVGRQISRNLLVRQLIEKQKPATATLLLKGIE